MGRPQEDFVQMYLQIGLNYLPDQLSLKIFSLLSLEPEEISLEELAQKTGFSLASISNKVKVLENMGMVKRSCHPGSKRCYVFMEKDVRKVMREMLLRKQEMLFNRVKQGLSPIINKYEGKSLNEREKQEIKMIKSYLKQMQEMEIIFQEFIQKLESGNYEK